MLRLLSILCATGLMLAAPAWAGGSGDCDGDGGVTGADAECARELINLTEGDDGFVADADMDGDGVISVVDLSAILNAAGD